MTLHTLQWAPQDAVKAESSHGAASSAIVLLHGLGDTADIWRPLMEHWRPALATVAFDLPGHGRSPWVEPDAYTCANLAEQVMQALAEHGISRPLLVGHSLGARICVDLAARPKMRPRGIILVDMGAGDADGSHAVNTAISDHIDAVIVGSTTIDGLVGLFLDRLPLADPDAVRCAVPAMAASVAERLHIPLDPAIKRLLAPSSRDDLWQAVTKIVGAVGIIRGAYSAVLTQAIAGKVAAAIPYQPVPVRVVEMAGHAIPLEQPSQLAQAIEGCLASMTLAD